MTREINSVDEYKPYSIGNKVYRTFEESVADLKNSDKDCSCTPDMFLIALDGLIDRFHRDFAWYSEPECVAVFPQVSEEQRVGSSLTMMGFSRPTSAMLFASSAMWDGTALRCPGMILIFVIGICNYLIPPNLN